MNDKEEIENTILQIAQHSAAIVDVIAILAVEVSKLNTPAATKIGNALARLSDDPNLKQTAAFADVAHQVSACLLGVRDQPLLTLEKRPPSESGLTQLQELLHRLKK